MILRFMQGDKAGKSVEIKGDNFTIGRESECDLLIDEDGISRLHCRIVKEGNDYFVQDTGSTNGVYVNGKKAEGRVKLADNDKVRIGPQILLYTTDKNVLADDKLEKLDEIKKHKETVSPAAPMSPVPEDEEKPAEVKPAEVKPAPTPAPAPAPPKTAPRPGAGINVVMGVVIAALVAALLYVALVDPKKGDTKKKTDDDVVLVSASDVGKGINVDDDSATTRTDTQVATPAAPDKAGPVAEPPVEPPPPAEPPKPEIAFADLPKIPAFLFLSNPAGAEVVIDGEVKGKTPVMVKGLKVGTGAVVLRKKGYRDLDTIFEVPMRGQAPVFQLAQMPGSFRISSDPSGASVMFGDQVLGETPWMVVDPVWTGKEITIRAAGYQPWNAAVQLSAAGPNHVKAQLHPLGGDLRIYTLPAGADIYIDGLAKVRSRASQKGESSPVVLENIHPGPHKVHIALPDGSKSEDVEVTVTTGQMKTVRPTIYTPNTMVVTKDKKIYEGMYRTTTSKGEIVLAVSDRKHKVFKKADVTEMKPLEE